MEELTTQQQAFIWLCAGSIRRSYIAGDVIRESKEIKKPDEPANVWLVIRSRQDFEKATQWVECRQIKTDGTLGDTVYEFNDVEFKFYELLLHLSVNRYMYLKELNKA